MTTHETGAKGSSMSFRAFNSTYLEPIMMWVMILGIVAVCQPWILFLHRYGLTIMILGLIGFLVASHIPPEAEEED